jgi:hypothetical protein
MQCNHFYFVTDKKHSDNRVMLKEEAFSCKENYDTFKDNQIL